MRGKWIVALGPLVLSKRERVIALEPYDKALLGTTLRYPYEVRKPEDYFCDLPDLAIAPTCSPWPSISWTARRQSLTPRCFGTAMRRRCWHTSRPSRPVPLQSDGRPLP